MSIRPATSPAAPAAPADSVTQPLPLRVRDAVLRDAPIYATTIFLVAMFLFFAISNGSRFYGADNLTTILGQSAILGIIACGLTMPLIVGNFDLSIGWHASFAGVLGVTIAANYGTTEAIALVLIIGVVIGILNGLIINYLRVSSLIATLGMGAVLVGASQWISGFLATGLPLSYSQLGQERLGTFPLAALLMLAFGAVLWALSNQTPFGRGMYAIGSNREASRLAGINIKRTSIIALAVSGFAAAFGGLVLSSTLSAGQVGQADALLLDGFTAAAIGMVTFRRGQFNIAGTILAVLLLETMLNGMTQIGWPAYWQNIVKGAILIGAVATSIGSSEDK